MEKWLTRDCVHRLTDSESDHSHGFLSQVIKEETNTFTFLEGGFLNVK